MSNPLSPPELTLAITEDVLNISSDVLSLVRRAPNLTPTQYETAKKDVLVRLQNHALPMLNSLVDVVQNMEQ